MLDKDGVVIYVGKARVLKNRVRQYFHGSEKPEKVAAMVEHIADFYYIITGSEIDALALENNLIKKYKPKYILTFLDRIATTYQNNRVMLSDGRKAKIVLLNPNRLSKPLVQLEDGDYLDLNKSTLIITSLI